MAVYRVHPARHAGALVAVRRVAAGLRAGQNVCLRGALACQLLACQGVVARVVLPGLAVACAALLYARPKFFGAARAHRLYEMLLRGLHVALGDGQRPLALHAHLLRAELVGGRGGLHLGPVRLLQRRRRALAGYERVVEHGYGRLALGLRERLLVHVRAAQHALYLLRPFAGRIALALYLPGQLVLLGVIGVARRLVVAQGQRVFIARLLV